MISGLADRVVLKGKLSPDELLPYYRQADVLAMPACIRNQDADGIPTVLDRSHGHGNPGGGHPGFRHP